MVHRPNEAVGIPPERFVLVHRFWTSEEDEDRHILMLANGKDPPEEMRMTPQNVGSFFNPFIESSHPVYTNVCKVVLIDSTASNTAKENIRNTPAIGYLAPTEDHPEPRPYFIYRFLLYSDGFSSGSSYTKRSDKGIYILPLNFKSHGRNSISSTRVLALAPPKVSPFSVFTALLDDIETGVTTGFDATDPNGIERKVFLDPVAVIGDTPALNYALDVLGHSGNSYCHLCKINKSVDVPDRSDSDTEDNAEGVNAEMGNIPLSDYMPIHNRTCSERFAFRHQSLMDSAAPANETRALGIKRTTAVSDYPLHRIANTLQTNRHLTPRDTHGERVVPCVINPYLGSLISPDHLITGLVKNCLRFALSFIDDRRHFDENLQNAFTANKITGVPRLIQPSSQALSTSVSCTHLYTIIMFAPTVYARTLSEISEPPRFASFVHRTRSETCSKFH